MPLVLFGIFCYTDTGKSPLWVKIRGKKEQFDEEIEKGMSYVKAGRVYSADAIEAEMKRDFGI